MLMLVAVLTFGVQSYAQKGMQGVGVNVTTAFNEAVNVGATIKYHYNISDFFRIEPSASYGTQADGRGVGAAGCLNLHAFLMSPRSCRPYLIGGAAVWQNKSDFCIGPDAGLGVDFRVSHYVSIQLEASALINVADDEGLAGKINLGVCYNF